MNKYMVTALFFCVGIATTSFASITVHNKLNNEVIIRTDGLMQADKDAENADMILYIQPKQKRTFELWKNPYNQERNIVEDNLNTYIDWPSAPWKIVFLDGTISKSSSDKMSGNDLINDKSYEITRDEEGYVFTEIKRGISESKVPGQTPEVKSQSNNDALNQLSVMNKQTSDINLAAKLIKLFVERPPLEDTTFVELEVDKNQLKTIDQLQIKTLNSNAIEPEAWSAAEKVLLGVGAVALAGTVVYMYALTKCLHIGLSGILQARAQHRVMEFWRLRGLQYDPNI